jgi:hypothetical protein
MRRGNAILMFPKATGIPSTKASIRLILYMWISEFLDF